MTPVTPAELAKACEERAKQGLLIAIVLDRPCTGARRMRLSGRRSPIGDVFCENCDGATVAYFEPSQVLKWLVEREEKA